MRLELSIAAERDLREIFDWTEQNFGLTQAVRYQHALNRATRAILSDPMVGKLYAGAKLETRRVVSGRHFIYYRSNGATVFVVRVLHQRMAQGQHLA